MYTPKIKLGDKVYLIYRGKVSKFVVCQFCNGQGIISSNFNIDHKLTARCPICHGEGGKKEWGDTQWQLDIIENTNIPALYKVGKLQLETTKKYEKWTIMCEETGIESGSCYYMEDAFLTIEEAKAECDKRNLTKVKES